MTEIFMHEYTITAWDRQKMGVQQVVITIVDEHKEGHSLEAVEAALKYFDKDMNVSHRILLGGYRND